MQMKRITAPFYYIGGERFNEYEIRYLQFLVATKQSSFAGTITDMKGNSATINSEGNLSEKLFGLDLSDNIALQMFLKGNSPLEGYEVLIPNR